MGASVMQSEALLPERYNLYPILLHFAGGPKPDSPAQDGKTVL